jgi:glycosyltransferase involved in cell wall biosynthesis
MFYDSIQKHSDVAKMRFEGATTTDNGGNMLIVLLSVGLGGTERRIGFLYKLLSHRCPEKYHLVINLELFDTLQKAGYEFEACRNIHILEKRSIFDVKHGTGSKKIVQLGRLFTLAKYRCAIKRIIKREQITAVQVFLEMVPFLGVFPIKKVKSIASLVSHLPIYYDKKNINCKLLLYALKRYDKIDALYMFIANNLIRLGVPRKKINCPWRNFVNHRRFRPEDKDKIVTFTARMLAFKNPLLLIDAITDALPQLDNEVKLYILGKGPELQTVQREVERRGLETRIITGFHYDPSVIVNRSLVHVCIEAYDNATNQSLLEGMASGCAIITSDAGLTHEVVTADIGLRINLTKKEISDALIMLLGDPKRIARMGMNARAKILSDHNIDQYLDYITTIHDFDKNQHIFDGKKQTA